MNVTNSRLVAPIVKVRVELEFQSISLPYRESIYLDVSGEMADIFTNPIDFGEGLTPQEELWLCTPPEVRAKMLAERKRLSQSIGAQITKALFDLMGKRDTHNGSEKANTKEGAHL